MRLILTQVAYSKPGADDGCRFHTRKFQGQDIDDLLKQLEEEFGITPPRHPKGVFRDTKDGDCVQVGFVTHRWAKGENKRYWEENWVVFESDPQPVPLPKKLQAKP